MEHYMTNEVQGDLLVWLQDIVTGRSLSTKNYARRILVYGNIPILVIQLTFSAEVNDFGVVHCTVL